MASKRRIQFQLLHTFFFFFFFFYNIILTLSTLRFLSRNSLRTLRTLLTFIVKLGYNTYCHWLTEVGRNTRLRLVFPPTLLSCSSHLLSALQQNRAQSRLLYLLNSTHKKEKTYSQKINSHERQKG